MTSSQHDIEQPSDDTVIWRYMDLWKFRDLLHRSSLFFPQLKEMEDKWDGILRSFDPTDSKFLKRYKATIFANSPIGYRSTTVISCWHMNDYESAGMWEAYVTSKKGVAVKTTVGNLKKSLLTGPIVALEYGKVKYIKDNEPPPDRIDWKIAFFKRIYYEFEREFRITGVVVLPEEAEKIGGVLVPIQNLNTLIKGVVIRADAPQWLDAEFVKNLLEKYGVNQASVTYSELDTLPYQ